MKNNKIISAFIMGIIFLSFKANVFAEGRVEVEDIKTSCDDMLGADLINIFKDFWAYILIAGAILLVVMSLIVIAKSITGSDEKAIKNLFAKIIKRIIGLAMLFLLPVIVEYLISWINPNLGICIN